MQTLDHPADLPLAAARERLLAPRRQAGFMPALASAAIVATAAVTLACAVILGPPWPIV